MKTKFPVDRFDSEGHKLIAELMAHLERAEPLSPESRDRWITCLHMIYLCPNKKAAASQLVDILKLRFKTGAPPGDTWARVYEIEKALQDNYSIDEACHRVALDVCRSEKTLRDEYFKYKKEYPEEYWSIRWVAERDHKSGGTFGKDHMKLFLALNYAAANGPDHAE